MNFDDLKNKATEALKSEATIDSVLDQAANAVNSLTGDKFADKVEQVREVVDGKIGDE